MVLRIGHRGAAGHAPDNTLLSFQTALDLGCDAVELDVRICRSGELVVFHDAQLEHATNGSGDIAGRDLAYIRTLNIEGQPIATLEEVLRFIKGRMQVFIELKHPGCAAPTHKVVSALVEEGVCTYDSLWVISFHHHEVAEYKSLCPQMRVGASIVGVPVDNAAFAERANAQGICPAIHHITPEFIADAHRRGLKVFVWTANEPEEISLAKVSGVDGIISNYPERI